MTAYLVVFPESSVQDEQKKRQHAATNGLSSVIPAALVKWRNIAPSTTREEIAAMCCRSVSTVDRWVHGIGEPNVSDVWLMEKHKPGLVEMLFSSTKKAARRTTRA
jgi:malate synthase